MCESMHSAIFKIRDRIERSKMRFTISEVTVDWHELMMQYRGALCGHLLPTPISS